MVNFNGNIQETSGITIENNRGFLFGDSIFETVKVVEGKVLFAEDHYFRLMASMRICRMEIPMRFTLEFFEDEIIKLTESLPQSKAYRARFTVFRVGDGLYLPVSNEVQFIVTASENDQVAYQINEQAAYEMEIYKDAYVTKQLFSTLKTNNKMLHITGSVFAQENGYDNCFLLNSEKNVIEALQSNIFMLMGNTLVTPPVSDGCLNGIMRKKILEIASAMPNISVEEKSISPFDLQKADEIFLTNVIKGIQPVTKYKKKSFQLHLAKEIVAQLNTVLNLA
ncbi:aminotransferase class IV [Flavobacterium sediminis]|uniref:branched-chain-amino-acid transaminase n=1 Tax=Flavobacterium sediminis TaxID=2201181 RepID=A0A2U8QRY2_9FLAO|nr:aminotransferase class IV [Flavobacterium sediminis]AWM12879.1 aminotransferase class IV [Flavobacterium sediminis]